MSRQAMAMTILLGLAAASAAIGEDIYVIRAQPDWATQFGNAGKADAERVGAGLGQALNNVVQGKRIARYVITVKCERYTSLVTVYADGSFKQVHMNEAVDRTDLETTKAVLPNLAVVEGGC